MIPGLLGFILWKCSGPWPGVKTPAGAQDFGLSLSLSLSLFVSLSLLLSFSLSLFFLFFCLSFLLSFFLYLSFLSLFISFSLSFSLLSLCILRCRSICWSLFFPSSFLHEHNVIGSMMLGFHVPRLEGKWPMGGRVFHTRAPFLPCLFGWKKGFGWSWGMSFHARSMDRVRLLWGTSKRINFAAPQGIHKPLIFFGPLFADLPTHEGARSWGQRCAASANEFPSDPSAHR